MTNLTPVLNQIKNRPKITRQPTIREFFKPRPVTDEEMVAKIRSKRMEKVIQQTQGISPTSPEPQIKAKRRAKAIGKRS